MYNYKHRQKQPRLTVFENKMSASVIYKEQSSIKGDIANLAKK